MTTTTTTSSSNIIYSNQGMTQNDALIWLNVGLDETNKECQNTLDQLQNMLNDVYIFTNSDECVDFLTDLEDTMALLVIEDGIGQQIMPLIHDIPQLDHVYGFSNSKSLPNEWIKEWPKVKGIHSTGTLLCKAIELALKQHNQDSIAVSFVSVNGNSSNQNLDQLEPSFMYTQIFKEILLEMKHDRKSIHDFVTFCQNGNYGSPSNIDLFKKEYRLESAIWWYTHPSFIYSMLNDALRMLQVDIIIKMGFFISHLHHEIQQLHQEQLFDDDAKSFIVYRGQGLWKKDFEKLQKIRGGLISFNNFLSTSRDEEVSLGYARVNLTRPGMIGVLFTMSINSSLSSIPFADIDRVSYFQTEKEILFSMHTVFRIIQINPMDNDSELYQVDLQLTPDDDEELRVLTKHIANQIGGDTGWDRLASLLLRIGYLNKAEELYNTLLEQTTNDSDRVHYYNQLLNIKFNQGDDQAIAGYGQKIIEIEKKTLPENDPSMVTTNNNIGMISCKTGECSRILLFYDKSPVIDENKFPASHDSLTSNCHNITTVADNIRKRSNALFYEKALETYQRTLSPNHPCLPTSYNNIASIFQDMTEHSKALAFNEKLLEMRQKCLPTNHPDLAMSCYNIAKMYQDREEHAKALSFHQQSLKIWEKTLPVSHPYLAIVCDGIAVAYHNMEEYLTALLFHEKALGIHQRTLPANHPSLATSYRNIASLYYGIKKYPEALKFHEKALETCLETLPPNHSSLATFYSNIASTHAEMAEYSKALPFYEKALEIHQETLPPKHPNLAIFFNNIASVYYMMANYTKAIKFHEKALETCQETLPRNDPLLATFSHNLGLVYYCIEKYSEALPHFERALNIFKISVDENDSRLESVKAIIKIVKKKLGI